MRSPQNTCGVIPHIVSYQGEDTLGTPVHSSVWPTAYSLYKDNGHYMALFGSTATEDVREVPGWTSSYKLSPDVFLIYGFIVIFIYLMCGCLNLYVAF